MKPWLWLPSRISHDISPFLLKAKGAIHSPQTFHWQPVSWRHLQFSNPLGICGGVDKNADSITGWWTLGPGFIEIGTVTPKAQKGHSGKVMDRNIETLSLWNKMGFPSKGAQKVSKNLSKIPAIHHTPIFVNIGKNKNTSNSQAHHDYMECLDKLMPYADAFVINISSPNTEGLRQLVQPDNLKDFLGPIIEYNKKSSRRVKKDITCPLLLKLSPDMDDETLESALNTTADLDIDGWVLTNTTTARERTPFYPQDGGVSGAPLTEKSEKVLTNALNFLSSKKQDRLVVSAGGILTAEDVFKRLELGADLTQVYSALVFHGPSFFKHVAERAPK